MKFQIEKNIEIPPKCMIRERSAIKFGFWKKIALQMEAGDSVLCKTHSQSEALKHSVQGIGRASITRRVVGGIRVWRLAK